MSSEAASRPHTPGSLFPTKHSSSLTEFAGGTFEFELKTSTKRSNGAKSVSTPGHAAGFIINCSIFALLVTHNPVCFPNVCKISHRVVHLASKIPITRQRIKAGEGENTHVLRQSTIHLDTILPLPDKTNVSVAKPKFGFANENRVNDT